MIRSIRTKLLSAQLGLALASILMLGLMVYWVAGYTLKAFQRDLLDQVAQHAGESVDALFDHKQNILAYIALGEPAEHFAAYGQDSVLLNYFSQYREDFPILSLVTPEGQESFSVHQGRIAETLTTIANTPLYQMALKKPNQTVFTIPHRNATSNATFVEFAFNRQSPENDINYIVVGKVPVTEFVDNANKFEFHKMGYAAILDDNGYFIAHPDHALIEKKLTTNISDLLAPRFQGVSRLSRHTRAMIMGNDSYVVYRLIPRRHWVALAVLPYAKYKSPLSIIRDSIILLVLALTAFTFVISSTLARHITRPIQTLVSATRNIASGNFKQRVTVTSLGEMGQLARSFNDMAKRLEATTTSLDKLNHEVRQRELAEKRQADLLKQIEATNTELKNFAYIVSHDLKAPLRGIKTIADWIQTDYADKLDEDGKEQLGMLSQRVERMKHLIEGILQYSRVGRDHEDIQTVHLDQIVPEIIDSLAVPDHITMTIDKPLPTVQYEPTRLSQIIQNLLSNAVKYMDKPHGEVHIGFTEDDDHWTFSISDNGPGIEEKYYDKIFGIFQTLNPRDEYESTGIGLAVVKKTIELAGGRIWVTSEVGKGSTFSFTLSKHTEPTKYPEDLTSETDETCDLEVSRSI